MALLEVNDLQTRFYTDDGVVKAVDGISYEIERGEKFGIVGESGAGKSVTSLSVMRLIDKPGYIEGGEVLFKGRNVLEMSQEELQNLRGNEISMVFQDPHTALNPVYTVGEQIAEAIRAHMDLSQRETHDRAVEMLERVGIPDPEDRYHQYPHEFSGGMQQRAIIAMALSCDPDLLIADEPTTALDVTIEAQILELLNELTAEFDTAIQLITHDLGVIAQLCDHIMVMYAGKAVENASAEELYYEPKHPYTVGLMGSIPRIGDERDRLETIPGTMPDLVQIPPGCSFHPRCPYAENVCTEIEPPLTDVTNDKREPATDKTAHSASCLAYTGDLSGELTYEVHMRDEHGIEETRGDGGE